MQFAQRALLICLCVIFAVGQVRAQQPHVVDSRALDLALTARAAETSAKRDAIRTAFQQPDVQRVATALGVDIARAEAAVGTLAGGDLDRVASQAQAVNDEIAGGQTVRLNLLWIIIALLIVILIVVAA
jgi:hypothetical protein